jgi:hypothetical protein
MAKSYWDNDDDEAKGPDVDAGKHKAGGAGHAKHAAGHHHAKPAGHAKHEVQGAAHEVRGAAHELRGAAHELEGAAHRSKGKGATPKARSHHKAKTTGEAPRVRARSHHKAKPVPTVPASAVDAFVADADTDPFAADTDTHIATAPAMAPVDALTGPIVRPNDPRPQVEIYTKGGEVAARRGPYTDQALTTYHAVQDVAAATPLPANQQALGGTAVYNPPEFQDSGFTPQVKKPYAPMAWRKGRDPYANDGMVGQDFFKAGGS